MTSILYTICEVIFMIFSNLSTILGKKKLRISDVIANTKISRPTLTALFYDSGKGINFSTLNELCRYLNVQPGDLFRFYDLDIDKIFISFDKKYAHTVISGKTKQKNNLTVFTDLKFNGYLNLKNRDGIIKLNFSGTLNNPEFDDMENVIGYEAVTFWDCTKDYYLLHSGDIKDILEEKIMEKLDKVMPHPQIEECIFSTYSILYVFTDSDIKNKVNTLENMMFK